MTAWGTDSAATLLQRRGSSTCRIQVLSSPHPVTAERKKVYTAILELIEHDY